MKSCSSQFSTLRIIIAEKSVEWSSSLYINFMDFEKATDSLEFDGALWNSPGIYFDH